MLVSAWGGALLASLVPHYGVSWQGHVCGGLAGVLAAWLLSGERRSKPTTPQDQLERALAK